MPDWLPVGARDERDADGALRLMAPLAVAPTGFGENAVAAWDTMWAENLAVSDELMLSDAWDGYLDQVEKVTGERPLNPAVFLGGLGVDNPVDAFGNLVSETLFDRPWALSREGRYHRAAASRSSCVPRPAPYMAPTLYCASASPCSAALRCQSRASASSRSTPRPPA